MSLLKLIFVGMGLLSLVIPFNVTNAGQFTVTSSEGVNVITTPEPSVSSSSETKGETWVRKYDYPGQQRDENLRESRLAAEAARIRNERLAEQAASNSREAERSMIELEKRRLKEKRCDSPSSQWNNYCTNKVRESLELLDRDPAYYFHKKANEPQYSPSVTDRARTNSGPSANSPRGAIDVTSGQYMPPAGGGVIDPRSGTFHQDVGGGYVNTRTGAFSPKIGP